MRHATPQKTKKKASLDTAYDIIAADRGSEPRLTLVPFADFCMMHAKVAICHTHTNTQGETTCWGSTVTAGGVDLLRRRKRGERNVPERKVIFEERCRTSTQMTTSLNNDSEAWRTKRTNGRRSQQQRKR